MLVGQRDRLNAEPSGEQWIASTADLQSCLNDGKIGLVSLLLRRYNGRRASPETVSFPPPHRDHVGRIHLDIKSVDHNFRLAWSDACGRQRPRFRMPTWSHEPSVSWQIVNVPAMIARTMRGSETPRNQVTGLNGIRHSTLKARGSTEINRTNLTAKKKRLRRTSE